MRELRALNEAIAQKQMRLVSLSVLCRRARLLKKVTLDSHDSHSTSRIMPRRAISLPVVTKRNAAAGDFTRGEWNGERKIFHEVENG
jgi:hypothetical protein